MGPEPPPIDTSTVNIASGGDKAVGEAVKGFPCVVEVDEVASGEVAGELFLGAKDDEHGSLGMGDEGHSGFDENIGSGLEPPCSGAVPWTDTLVWGEEGDDGLDISERLVKDGPYVRARLAGSLDEIIPFLGLQADCAEPVEQGGVGFRVVAIDDHDLAVARRLPEFANEPV